MASDAERLAEALRAASRVVAFTGAGISTESGIPDFRSPGGVWSQMSPIYFQEFLSSPQAQREAWRRVFERTAGWTGAAPNAGHVALARLSQMGRLRAIITQNVDNLHQDAGAPADIVIEVHGNASYAKCLQCERRYEFEDLRATYDAGEPIRCRLCAGLVKSATVSFGQPMPEAEMARATAEATACDLFLVLGSSLAVFPAAGLPLLAKRSGAALVIVNREPTDQDGFADLVLHAEIGPTLSAAVDRLGV